MYPFLTLFDAYFSLVYCSNLFSHHCQLFYPFTGPFLLTFIPTIAKPFSPICGPFMLTIIPTIARPFSPNYRTFIGWRLYDLAPILPAPIRCACSERAYSGVSVKILIFLILNIKLFNLNI
ncbi:unnamed protein product [Meloidogyne enterolobii]|uniref:Uncharacterized protein n=1 Tax=Meloidogyne enterolobii TaxID=390850 RepID=A0ACB0YXT9_MELEN